ncbi:UvrD-helicase domain-containing protein [Paenibacillus turicensis]|uniref:UvrD-helicase domain-containing protein n=1 Tax=Paenibacillus turicensis TaxID=160487 RepID=UPI003158ACB4
MTYTNAAVKEIEDRVNHPNLWVSTIHDFLWDNIKNYQNDLKKALIALINDEDSKIISPDGKVDKNYFDHLKNGIQYKEYNRIREGIISHDEMLALSNIMFKQHELLCDILKDKYQFIFVDEYQDTSPVVIEIFLEHIQKSKKNNIIGFFGDSMQSIYDNGVGDLTNYIDSGLITEIQKKQNRRNPKQVIDLANQLRLDDLIQEPSSDLSAPNMLNGKIKEGSIKFLYSDHANLEQIKELKYFKDWDFNDSTQTKELYLTHNLIADKAGFPSLMDIYDKDPIISLKNKIRNTIKKQNIDIDESSSFDEVVDSLKLMNREKKLLKDVITQNPSTNSLYKLLKDRPYAEVKNIYLDKDSLIDDKKDDENDNTKAGSKRDDLIKHLFKIQKVVHLYQEKHYNEFIRNTEFSINSVKDKVEISKIFADFHKISKKTIEDVIEYTESKLICRKDDKYHSFVKKNDYVFSRVKNVKYEEFQNLFYYLEGFTPFSTQHKIKGAEFENVFVVLDNGKWNNFNFEYLFTNRQDKLSVYNRTKKIFYVCCTRAKDNLVLFFHNPNEEIVQQAKNWFGKDNVIKV